MDNLCQVDTQVEGDKNGARNPEVWPHLTWLVVWTPLKNISQLGWLFPIYGKIKNVPNHQPVTHFAWVFWEPLNAQSIPDISRLCLYNLFCPTVGATVWCLFSQWLTPSSWQHKWINAIPLPRIHKILPLDNQTSGETCVENLSSLSLLRFHKTGYVWFLMGRWWAESTTSHPREQPKYD